jgi:hypothetical protein
VLVGGIEEMKRRLEKEPTLLTWMTWLGAAMCLMGFLSWYYKHQLHQDTIVKCQARKAVADAQIAERQARPEEPPEPSRIVVP